MLNLYSWHVVYARNLLTTSMVEEGESRSCRIRGCHSFGWVGCVEAPARNPSGQSHEIMRKIEACWVIEYTSWVVVSWQLDSWFDRKFPGGDTPGRTSSK
jgi:hypothetical protein